MWDSEWTKSHWGRFPPSTSFPLLVRITAPNTPYSSIVRGWYNRPISGGGTKRTVPGFLSSFPYSVLTDSLLHSNPKVHYRYCKVWSLHLILSQVNAIVFISCVSTVNFNIMFPFMLRFLSSKFPNQKFTRISFVNHECYRFWKLLERNE
jgi:hypothetical protein